MNTIKKFTVILSAYDDSQPTVHNLIASEQLADELTAHNFTGISYQRAVGCFDGQAEQCFIVSTNSSNLVNELKRIAWTYDQQCVLVSNNQAKRIQLHYPDSAPLMIGDRFAINNKLAGNGLLSYTVVRGEYWAAI